MGFLVVLGGTAAPQEQERDREQVGWWDEEDGGIYRCLDICMRFGVGFVRDVGGRHVDDDDDDDEDWSGNGGN